MLIYIFINGLYDDVVIKPKNGGEIEMERKAVNLWPWSLNFGDTQA